MLKVIDTHLCDYAFLAEGGKLSMVGIFDHFWSDKFPLVVPPFHIVFVFEGEPESESKSKVSINDPDGKVIFSTEGSIKVGPSRKVNLNLSIAGLKFENPGNYRIVFSEESKEIGRIELPVLERIPPKV
jgi:hypothetical protein